MANNYTQASFLFKCGTSENAALVLKWLDGKELPYALKFKINEYRDDILAVEEDGEEYFMDSVCEAELSEGHSPDTQQKGVIWIAVTEGDLDLVVIILDYALQTLRGDEDAGVEGVADPQGFEWANWCDKARVGAFGGGAVYMTRGMKPEFHHTSNWLSDALNGGGKL